jgi:hypothetical protein
MPCKIASCVNLGIPRHIGNSTNLREYSLITGLGRTVIYSKYPKPEAEEASPKKDVLKNGSFCSKPLIARDFIFQQEVLTLVALLFFPILFVIVT